MDWFTKHADTVVTIGALIGSMLWMNGNFNSIDRRFSELEKDIAIIKTVLVMKNIMPTDLCKAQEEK